MQWCLARYAIPGIGTLSSAAVSIGIFVSYDYRVSR